MKQTVRVPGTEAVASEITGPHSRIRTGIRQLQVSAWSWLLHPTRPRLGAVWGPLHPTRPRLGAVCGPLHPTRPQVPASGGTASWPINAAVPEAYWAACTQLASSLLMVAAPGLGGVDVDAGEPWVGRGLAVSLEATHPWLGNVGGVLGGAPIRPRATSGECSTRGKARASESIPEGSDNLSPPTYVVMSPPTYVIMFPLTYVVGFEKTFSKIQNGRYKQKNSQHNLAHQNK
jgi:hypothetical protein